MLLLRFVTQLVKSRKLCHLQIRFYSMILYNCANEMRLSSDLYTNSRVSLLEGGCKRLIICRKREGKKCGVEACSQPWAQVILRESQSLISQAEMTKISASYISRQDCTPVWYCYFLLGFSRVVNSCRHRRTTAPPICSPLSSGDLCHFNPQSLPLVNKEILCQLSPTTSCWESSRESKGPESLSHQRGAVGLIKWPLSPAGCRWPGDR